MRPLANAGDGDAPQVAGGEVPSEARPAVEAARRGDVAVAVRSATELSFAPFGRLLVAGERSYLGKRGQLLLALDEKRVGPRRVSDLYRYPEAKRVILPMGRGALWLVAVEGGARPRGEPLAFSIPPGCGVVINEGVWHAGPMPLADTSICELLETVGAADRFDRRSLRELIGIEGVRVLLEGEDDAAPACLDISAAGAVCLDAGYEGCVTLGCLAIEGLALDRCTGEEVWRLESARARAQWGEQCDPMSVPRVVEGRRVLGALGLDLVGSTPPAETLLAHALAGAPLPGAGSEDALAAVCLLRARLPVTLCDLDTVGLRLELRPGLPGEVYESTQRREVSVHGMPVLCDEAGPLGSPLADAHRARLGPGTRRLLVVAYVPVGMATPAVEALLRDLGTTVCEHFGGEVGGALILG